MVAMRTALPQPSLDLVPITAVPLNTQCRDEMVPILAGLQAIYADPATRDGILDLVAKDVNPTASATRGRPGLLYWQILVLAAVRQGCNLNYDRLQNLAEEHNTLRRIMGIGTWEDDLPPAERNLDWRRLRDNVCLVRPETLDPINTAVVQLGHRLVPDAPEQVRGDSFVVDTNIHYPTDAHVLVDGLRKITQLALALAVLLGLPGWRQGRHLQRRFKKQLRLINTACKSKKAGADARRRQAYQPLLKLARRVLRRARKLLAQARGTTALIPLDEGTARLKELEHYVDLTERVAENGRRRVVLGETVPNGEKIFSVFEPHTELVNRGKTPQAIQFGRRVLTIEDRAGFIVHYDVIERGQQDADIAEPMLQKAQQKCANRIKAASFDRGFHSPANQQKLAKVVASPCVPVRGHRQAERQQAEATEEFQQQRRWHPGVESLIHGLQAGNGLNRCRDRSEPGLKRYVGLAVLGRNLHVLGKVLLAQADPDCEAAKHRRGKKAG
jgi:transposase, IS5 family